MADLRQSYNSALAMPINTQFLQENVSFKELDDISKSNARLNTNNSYKFSSKHIANKSHMKKTQMIETTFESKKVANEKIGSATDKIREMLDAKRQKSQKELKNQL